MPNRQSAATPAQYEALIQPDVRWFQIALQRGLHEEAAEIVLDWVEYWCACQRAQQDDSLAAIHRAVRRAGEDVIPFLAAFAVGIFSEEKWNYLLHWLALMQTPAAQSAAEQVRQKGFVGVGESAIEQLCQAVYQARQQDAQVIAYRHECEAALRQLLGEILNHSMSARLTPVTEQLSLLAREVFFMRTPTWRHVETHTSDGSGPHIFEFGWAPQPDGVPVLIAEHDALVPQLIETLRRLPVA